jgi:Zn-finger nucleic acid-binding protein
MTDQDITAGRPCPRCGAGLFAGAVGTLTALGCGGCGGLWLDNEATSLVLRQYSVSAASIASLVDGNAARKETLSPFATAPGGCPVCEKPLQPVEHGGVRLDFCGEHGTFLDRGELARILEKNRPPVPQPTAPSGPTMEEIQTTVRHEAQWQKDPIGTALMDWVSGGKGWVNRGRR